MFQNIKVDIIYYLTNTDFEMEFNLCGCCRMRLLTDKATDRKGLVHLLARAVSRSRVIIACGSLFGESGLINSISQSISRPLAVVDNKAYAIADDNEIKIIKGAMPLVTPEGYFGGCIIESGPQTIILLTENKSIRKAVMSTLIHPYIEELSLIPAEPTASAQPRGAHEMPPEKPDISMPIPSPTEPVIPNAPLFVPEAMQQTDDSAPLPAAQAVENTEEDENAVPQVDASEVRKLPEDNENIPDTDRLSDTQSVSEPEVASPLADIPAVPVSRFANHTDDQLPSDAKTEYTAEHNIPFTLESDQNQAVSAAKHNGDFDLYIEPEKVKYSKKSYYEIEYNTSEKDSQFYSEAPDCKRHPSEHRSFKMPILILSVLLLLALAVLAYLLVYLPIRDGYSFSQFTHKIFNGAITMIRNPQFILH